MTVKDDRDSAAAVPGCSATMPTPSSKGAGSPSTRSGGHLVAAALSGSSQHLPSTSTKSEAASQRAASQRAASQRAASQRGPSSPISGGGQIFSASLGGHAPPPAAAHIEISADVLHANSIRLTQKRRQPGWCGLKLAVATLLLLIGIGGAAVGGAFYLGWLEEAHVELDTSGDGVHAGTLSARTDWQEEGAADPSAPMLLTFVVNASNQSTLHALIRNASTPGHAAHTRFLQYHHVTRLLRNDAGTDRTSQWLEGAGAMVVRVYSHGHHIQAVARVDVWEKALKVEIGRFVQPGTGSVLHRARGRPHVPHSIAEHLVGVVGLSHLPPRRLGGHLRPTEAAAPAGTGMRRRLAAAAAVWLEAEGCLSDPCAPGACDNQCQWSNDGACDDGGSGSEWSACGFGHDCGDCGFRAESSTGNAAGRALQSWDLEPQACGHDATHTVCAAGEAVASVTPGLLRRLLKIPASMGDSAIAQWIISTGGEMHSSADLTMFQEAFGVVRDPVAYGCPGGTVGLEVIGTAAGFIFDLKNEEKHIDHADSSASCLVNVQNTTLESNLDVQYLSAMAPSTVSVESYFGAGAEWTAIAKTARWGADLLHNASEDYFAMQKDDEALIAKHTGAAADRALASDAAAKLDLSRLRTKFFEFAKQEFALEFAMGLFNMTTIEEALPTIAAAATPAQRKRLNETIVEARTGAASFAWLLETFASTMEDVAVAMDDPIFWLMTAMTCVSGETGAPSIDDASDSLFGMSDVAGATKGSCYGKPPPAVVSISWGVLEDELTPTSVHSFNMQAGTLALLGVTVVAASGDGGAGSVTSAAECGRGLRPTFPATSPYVTVVGATQGAETGGEQVACSHRTGGGITSGGGFSSSHDWSSALHDWQQDAVLLYLLKSCKQQDGSTGTQLYDEMTSDTSYDQHEAEMEELLARCPLVQQVHAGRQGNISGRAYPDVSLPGHALQMVSNGAMVHVDGTSGAAPVFAAMVAGVVAQRYKQGMTGTLDLSTLDDGCPGCETEADKFAFIATTAEKSPRLGWLNPTLYGADSSTFHDVTSGSNVDGRGVTCDETAEGMIEFTALSGWDPVTGLGWVDFPSLLSLFPTDYVNSADSQDGVNNMQSAYYDMQMGNGDGTDTGVDNFMNMIQKANKTYNELYYSDGYYGTIDDEMDASFPS